MAVSDDNYRPYAAVANVQAVLDRVRNRNMPSAIDATYIRAAQVPEKSIGRVRDALRFLDFVHADGTPTQRLQAYAVAAVALGEQKQDLLAAAVRDSYRADFERIDPAQDAQDVIVDAFSPYAPKSQRIRMVMLFLGLCRFAGIPVMDAPRDRSMTAVKPKRKLASNDVKKSSGRPTQSEKLTTAQPIHRRPGDIVFGITEYDIALLAEDDFNEVWAALGKVARARSGAARQQTQEVTTPEV